MLIKDILLAYRPNPTFEKAGGNRLSRKGVKFVEKGLLSVDELAAYLGVSRWSVYQWISQRRVPYVKIGRLVRFDKVEIRGWVDGRRVKPINDF